MLENEKYIKGSSASILEAVRLFHEYHELMHESVSDGHIKSSVDRGTFSRPQDILPESVLDLLGPKRRSDSYSYGPECGDPVIRKTIAEIENMRHGTHYRTDHVAITPGAWQGLEFVLQEIMHLDKGKIDDAPIAVIGPTLYQMFHYPIQSLGMNIVAYNFVKPGSPHVPTSMDDLEDIFRIKPRAIVITNPNNPDGLYFPTDLLEKVVERAEHERVYVIIDEIQNFFPRSGETITYGPWIQSPFVIRLDSPSKRYGMADYRVGWLIAHPELVGNRVNGIVGRMSGMIGNAPRAANTALLYLLEKEKSGEAAQLFSSAWEELHNKEEYVLSRLNELKDKHDINKIFPRDACTNLTIQVNCPYICGQRYPNPELTDIQLAEQLMEEGTLIMPASGYGYDPKDLVFRITFAERKEKLEHSLDTLKSVLNPVPPGGWRM